MMSIWNSIYDSYLPTANCLLSDVFSLPTAYCQLIFHCLLRVIFQCLLLTASFDEGLVPKTIVWFKVLFSPLVNGDYSIEISFLLLVYVYTLFITLVLNSLYKTVCFKFDLINSNNDQKHAGSRCTSRFFLQFLLLLILRKIVRRYTYI